jgi:prevent-host-death family protein
MEKVTNSSELRSNLSLVLDEVQFNQDSYVIERKGRAAAVIVPLTVYENWKRSRERFFETIRRVQEVNQDADPDEVMRDVLEAQQAVRAEITKEN